MAISFSGATGGSLFPTRLHPSAIVGALAFALIVVLNAAYLGYQGGRTRALGVRENAQGAAQAARYEQEAREEARDRGAALAFLLRQQLRAGEDPVVADVSPDDPIRQEEAEDACSVVITVRSSAWEKLGAGGRAAVLRDWQAAWAPLCCSPSCHGRAAVRGETGALLASLPLPPTP